MSVLEDSISVVREAESLVLGRRFKFQKRLANAMADAVLHVPWFMLAGMQALLMLFAFAVLLIPVWWLLLFCLLLLTGEDTSVFSSWMGWMTATLLATGSVMFSLPSRSTARGVRREDVAQLADYIGSITSDQARLELLRAGVGNVDVVGMRRLSTLGWAVGFYWAILFWAISSWVFTPSVAEPLREGVVSHSFIGLFVFIFFGSGVACYREAYRMMSQTIAFAFLEVDSVERTRAVGRNGSGTL